MKSNPPEHSGGRGRAVVLDVFQRGAVRRIYAAHRFFKIHNLPTLPRVLWQSLTKFTSLFFFFSFSFLSFFFLGGFLSYSPNDFRTHFGQKYRFIGQKYRLNRAKVPSKWDKSTVLFRASLKHCPKCTKKPIKTAHEKCWSIFHGPNRSDQQGVKWLCSN